MSDTVRVAVYPRKGASVPVPTPDSTSLPTSGATVDLTEYILELLREGELLTYDPLAIGGGPPDYLPIPTGGGGFSSVTLSALGLSTSSTTGQMSATYGAAAIMDGRQGLWFRDPSSTETSDNALIVGSGTGRWKRYRENNLLNVRWFGAKGDGTTDDTAAIQAALNACSPNKGGIFIPCGTYRITSTLYSGWDGNGNYGISIVGEASTASYQTGATILWDGAATNMPAWWLSGYDFRVRDIGVKVNAGKTLYAGWELGNRTATQRFHSKSSWEHCTISSESTDAVLLHGFCLGSKFSASGNLEDCSFSKCYVLDARGFAFFLASGQPYSTMIQNCMVQNTQTAQRGAGVRVNVATADVQLISCEFQRVEIVVYVRDAANISIIGGGSEHCKKLYVSEGNFIGGLPAIFSVNSHRGNNTSINIASENFAASDHKYIWANDGECVRLSGLCCDDMDANNHVQVAIEKGCSVVSTGNTFSQTIPWVISDNGTSTRVGGIWSSGDRYTTNAAVVFGSQVISLPSMHGSFNFSNTATVSGAATSVAVTFVQSEFIADYNVRLDVESVTGTPAAGAFTPYVTSKTATGFTVNVPTAPGVGNSVVVRYTLWR